MCPALRARQRVDLIDDHGRDPAKRVARCRGEDEEERFGSGDEDVGWPGAEAASLVGGGVTRPHAHGDVGLVEPKAH